VTAAGLPFSFRGFRGEEAFAAFGASLSGLAWILTFGSRDRDCCRAVLDALFVKGCAGDGPAGGAVLPGFVEQFGAA
jgi:hypothetical protein